VGGGGGDGSPSSGGGYLSYPANGPITSPFGLRYHPILHIWRLHSGIDFGIPCGTPVYAAAAGTIISAGWAGGYGNRIVIDHGIVRGVDLATTYNHLTSIVAGGRVRRGQLIGYSGTTGLSTGCHLHFETLVDGTFVNPMNWL
jgi:murein DD-endopeptidase MepM/ murein hydrolase activator NlpD